MEDFESTAESTWETCEAEIRASGAYVLLVGSSYGSILPRSGMSYSHAEYELAQILGLPTLVFVSDNAEASIPRADDPVRLRAFLDQLKAAHTLKFVNFDDLDALAEEVRSSVLAVETGKDRPTFHRSARPIADPKRYAAGTVRRSILRRAPFTIFIADLAVADASDYPRHLNRRLGNKSQELLRELSQRGATVHLLNDIEVAGQTPDDTLRKRAAIVNKEADVTICLLQGHESPDLLQLFADAGGPVALWRPAWYPVTEVAGASDHEYDVRELNSCELAFRIERHVSGLQEAHARRGLRRLARA
jgi:hypothetical protein